MTLPNFEMSFLETASSFNKLEIIPTTSFMYANVFFPKTVGVDITLTTSFICNYVFHKDS